MARCANCGNDYDDSFTVTLADGSSGQFDSFECATHAFAPRCEHCGTPVLGHGVRVGTAIYCCSHCARETTGVEMTDSLEGSYGGA